MLTIRYLTQLEVWRVCKKHGLDIGSDICSEGYFILWDDGSIPKGPFHSVADAAKELCADEANSQPAARAGQDSEETNP
jgi:hypothetical protein